MATPRFELYEKAGWYWRLVDEYGRIVATSFRYGSKANAKKAAQKAKDAAAEAAIVEAHPDVDVTAVAGSAFGASVDITISGLGSIALPATPSVSLTPTGGHQAKTSPKANVGPGGLFLSSGPLRASSHGAVGPSGSSTCACCTGRGRRPRGHPHRRLDQEHVRGQRDGRHRHHHPRRGDARPR